MFYQLSINNSTNSAFHVQSFIRNCATTMLLLAIPIYARILMVVPWLPLLINYIIFGIFVPLNPTNIPKRYKSPIKIVIDQLELVFSVFPFSNVPNKLLVLCGVYIHLPYQQRLYPLSISASSTDAMAILVNQNLVVLNAQFDSIFVLPNIKMTYAFLRSYIADFCFLNN
jgi:hypothetical protein